MMSSATEYVSMVPGKRVEDHQDYCSLATSRRGGNSTGKAAGSAFLLMAGFAGAGKTTLATWLYEKLLQHKGLEWRVLDKDNLKRNHLAEGEEPELAGWNAYEDLFD